MQKKTHVEVLSCKACGRLAVAVDGVRVTGHKCAGAWDTVLSEECSIPVEPCATLPEGPKPTHVYLTDGTKVVIRRSNGAHWLAVVPQAKFRPAKPLPSPLAGLSEADYRPPTAEERKAADERLEKVTKPYRDGARATRGRRL